ncbi:MAG: DUF937 domain-containing protein [Fimbriimonadales bacterium]
MNLIELLKSQLSGGLVQKLASLLGIDESAVSKLLDGALPAILGGIGAKAQTSGGAEMLSSMIRDRNLPADADSLSSRFEEGDPDGSPAIAGESLLGGLFGEKLDRITSFLGNFAGIDKTTAAGLLATVAPMILGFLGKQAPGGGTDPSQFAGFLNQNLPDPKSLMPAGLGDMVDLPDVPDMDRVAAGAATVGPSVSKAATTASGRSAEASGGGMNWLAWLIGILAVGGLIWWFMNRKPENKVPETPAVTSPDAVTNAPETPGVTEKELPSGVKIRFPDDSVEAKLIEFIENADKPVDQTSWFTFERLEFDTGKATLRPASDAQLDNVAAILDAYPNVHLKIGGYTDNTGGADANMKLSAERATNTMHALVGRGIGVERVEAEGYGQEHPIADNTTEEGKQRNRRIDARVTAK